MYTEPALREDVAGLIRNRRQITAAIDSGKGLVHALIYDTQATSDGKRLLAAAARDAGRFDAAINESEGILREIGTRSRSPHAFVYAPARSKASSELRDVAA